MKKLIYTLTAIATLAFAAGCANELDGPNPVKGEFVETEFTVALDDATATKAAIGNDAAKIDKLLIRAFKSDGTSLKELDGNFEIDEVTTVGGKKQFGVKAKLVRNFPYKIAFFALHNGAPYTMDDNGVITMAAGAANDENLDVFYKVEDITLDPDTPATLVKTITLTRPLAQINVLSDPADWAAAKATGILEGLKSSVTITAPTKLNLVDGTVDTPAELAFTLEESPTGKINVGAAESAVDANYVAMAYILSGTAASPVNVTFHVESANFAGFTRTVNNVPNKANFRTNLHGDLFTTSGDFTVVLDPDFGSTDDNQNINIPQPTVSPASIPDGILSANPGIVKGASVATTGNNISLTTASSPLYFGIDSNSDGEISYASSKPAVGTISEEGVFTVVGAGDTDVTIHQMAGNTKATTDYSDITIVYHVHVDNVTLNITFYAGENGDFSEIKLNNADATLNEGVLSAVKGNVITFKATPVENYEVDAVKVGDDPLTAEDGVYSYTVGDNAVTISASFKEMGTVAAPTFSPAAGEVAANTTVTISCATEGATIHYTVDGTEPTTESATYSSAITIDVAKTIKAIAVKAGMINSAVATAAYTIKPVLSSISVDATGATTEFANGAAFSSEGIVVTASYTQGKADANVTAQAVVTTPNMTEAGTKDVTVSYTEDGITKTATYEITVAAAVTPKSDQTLSFDKDELVFAYGATYTLPVLSGAQTTVTYSIEDVSPAGAISVDPSTGALTITKAGAGMVYARAAETEEYNAGEAYYMVTVNKATQTLSFGATSEFEITYGDSFTEPTLTGAQNTVTYSIEATKGNVTINAATGKLTISGEDYVIVTATTVDDGCYVVATDSYELTINAAGGSEPQNRPSYAFSAASVTATIGETAPTYPTLNGTVAGDTPVYSSTNTSVATVNVSTGAITLVGKGTTIIKASVAAHDDYTAQEVSYTLNVKQWVQVTSSSTALSAGDRIFITSLNGSTKKVMSTTQNNNNRAAEDFDPDDIKDSYQIIILETVPSGKGEGSFALSTGNGYLYAASSSSNHLKTEPELDSDGNGSWDITISTTGTTIVAKGTSTRNSIRYNSASSNGNLFSCYASGQQAVIIYRLEQ